MYGDLLDDDVSAGEMWKNAAIRGSLEAAGNCFYNACKFISSLKGLLKQERYLERYAFNDA
jgi:hypothetical protein